MSSSSFPRSAPATDVVTGHRLTDDGVFERVPMQVSVLPGAGGMWTTAADLVRFGLAWSSLLPEALAREALRPQAEAEGVGSEPGLGWSLVPPKDVAGHPGAGAGCSASLIIRPSGGRPLVVFTNRQVLVEAINERLALPLG
jgi:CubicO group peptidase (beta-lactamase class C family)